MSGCPWAAPTRIACVGDSLTHGDSLHAYKPYSVPRCSWADPHCRGNWPLTLGALLGKRFDVRNFGQVGWPACARLPEECVLPPTDNQTERLPLTTTAAAGELDACERAMRRWPLTRDALAFAPHVVVVLLGTNDAVGTYWERCGALGFERALLLLLRALLAARPYVLLLEPPPVLGEASGGICFAAHLCRYNPRRCAATAECTSCLADDSVRRSGCVWIPQLRQVRASIRKVAASLDHAHGLWKTLGLRVAGGAERAGGKWEHAHWRKGGRGCGQSMVRLAPPLPIEADPELYQGPIHLNARGSALVACAVHAELQHCGSDACEGANGTWTTANSSRRHEELCTPYFKRYVRERISRGSERSWHAKIETSILGPQHMNQL
ncbi:hypothetical protein AB1Y20_021193 [Prymnesium parvum]|uniref:SGNH hydrolase-type esterase domain-containing protein n=1 Tax=Prymnesium parvum TaxID=97485 RepID=A0AB34JI26_PRYPA